MYIGGFALGDGARNRVQELGRPPRNPRRNCLGSSLPCRIPRLRRSPDHTRARVERKDRLGLPRSRPRRPGGINTTMDFETRARARMVKEQLRRRGIADTRVLAAMEAKCPARRLSRSPNERTGLPRWRPSPFTRPNDLSASHGRDVGRGTGVERRRDRARGRGRVGLPSGGPCRSSPKRSTRIEIIPELVAKGASDACWQSLGIGNVELICGDGRQRLARRCTLRRYRRRGGC